MLEQRWKCGNKAGRIKEYFGLNGQRAKAGHVKSRPNFGCPGKKCGAACRLSSR